jgi:hypothetical protein
VISVAFKLSKLIQMSKLQSAMLENASKIKRYTSKLTSYHQQMSSQGDISKHSINQFIVKLTNHFVV